MARRGRKPAPLVAPIDADQYLERNRLVLQAKVAQEEKAAEHRVALKRAKAAGLDTAAYALHTKLRKMEPSKAIDLIRTALRYASWEKAPYATQADMFKDPMDNVRPSEEAQRKQVLLAAEDAGRMTGTGGNSDTLNPYQQGTEEFVAWLNGWTGGNEFYQRSKPEGETVAKAGGSGRPRGKRDDPAPTHAAPVSAQ